MKISVLQVNIQKALNIVSRFTVQHTQLPVLSHVGLIAKDKQLFLVATDMQVGIRMRVAGKIIEEGSIAIPGKVLNDLIKSLNPGVVELVVQEAMLLEVDGGNVKAKIQGMSLADFPVVEDFEGEIWQKMSVSVLNQVVERISFTLSSDDSRPILTGMYWNLESGRAAATDGFRLSVVDGVFMPKKDSKEASMVVNGRLLQEASKVLTETKEVDTSLFYNETSHQLYIKGEEILLVGRILQGEYPNFEAIIPKKIKTVVMADKELILRAVRSVAIFARDNANIVEIAIEEGMLKVQARSIQIGENQAVLEIEADNQNKVKTAFNSRYLLDFLTQVKKEKIIISFQGELEAVLFEEEGDTAFKHVIMPMKIQGN